MAALTAISDQNQRVRPRFARAAQLMATSAITHSNVPDVSENAVSARPGFPVSETTVYTSRNAATVPICQCVRRFILLCLTPK